MSVPIRVPDLGAADDNVTLVRWLVDEGAVITRGQKIAAIETDKALVELESVASGVLLKKCADEGADATVGDVIAYIGNAGETVPEGGEAHQQIGLDVAGKESPERPVRSPASSSVADAGRPRVSPVVRNLARQRGVDLDKVLGTGPGGVITRQDVLAASKQSGG